MIPFLAWNAGRDRCGSHRIIDEQIIDRGICYLIDKTVTSFTIDSLLSSPTNLGPNIPTTEVPVGQVVYPFPHLTSSILTSFTSTNATDLGIPRYQGK
jgi:hypothetical protein